MLIAHSGGQPCPRCGGPTGVYRHEKVTDKQRSQPFYYAQWYWCRDGRCATQQIMPEESRVYPEDYPWPVYLGVWADIKAAALAGAPAWRD